ncbi:MAG: hypothetical protein ACPG7F_00895 [Aggregatilineales bacterium]
MIRISASYDAKPLRNMQTYFRNFDDIASREIKREADVIGRSAVQKLAPPVPDVRYPIQWASERQRKAFFATDGFGKGIPTRRTGGVQKQWRYELNKTAQGYRFSIYNSKPYAKYLFGSLAQDKRKAARFQQAMHKNTGYPLAQPVVIDALDKLTIALNKNVRNVLIQAFKRRAFTGR